MVPFGEPQTHAIYYVSRVMRKPDLCRETAQLISAFVFVTPIVQCLFYLSKLYKASSLLQFLYRLGFCHLVGNPEDRFSRASSHNKFSLILIIQLYEINLCYYAALVISERSH